MTVPLDNTFRSQALKLSLGEVSCATLREDGWGSHTVNVSVLEATSQGAQSQYMATVTPEPLIVPKSGDTCNDISQPYRVFVIGVYGMDPEAIETGLPYSLSVDVQPRQIQIGQTRTLAILGGRYNAFVLSVQPGKAFSARALVTSYTGLPSCKSRCAKSIANFPPPTQSAAVFHCRLPDILPACFDNALPPSHHPPPSAARGTRCSSSHCLCRRIHPRDCIEGPYSLQGGVERMWLESSRACP